MLCKYVLKIRQITKQSNRIFVICLIFGLCICLVFISLCRHLSQENDPYQQYVIHISGGNDKDNFSERNSNGTDNRFILYICNLCDSFLFLVFLCVQKYKCVHKSFIGFFFPLSRSNHTLNNQFAFALCQ